MAGLLAETGLTLLESEAAALRALAATPDDVLERMLSAPRASPTCSQRADRRGAPAPARSPRYVRFVAVREVRAGRNHGAQLGP